MIDKPEPPVQQPNPAGPSGKKAVPTWNFYEKMASSARLGPTNAAKVSHSRTAWRERAVPTRRAAMDAELTKACG